MKTVTLTEKQAELAIYLLEQLSERLGNDGCNDLSKKEEKLIKSLKNDILETTQEDEDGWISNFSLSDYIRIVLEKQLKE